MHCLAVICAILAQSQISPVLGHVEAGAVTMHRGLPQGAPESPLIFVLVIELVLRPLLTRWRDNGSGWRLDDFWLPCVCFADDLLLVSSSKQDLQTMVVNISTALSDVGLEISPQKCHWTSYPAEPGGFMTIAGSDVSWQQNLVFVGCKLNLCGNDGGAMEHRMAQGHRVYHLWKPYLLAKHASLSRRLALLSNTVMSSSLWLCQTWLLTRRQSSHFCSWGARMVAQMARTRRSPTEDIGHYWRRLHRYGHGLLRVSGGSLDARRKLKLHSYAGHIARSTSSIIKLALRTRCLSWWRFMQSTHSNKRTGVHPKRFKAWRWESQLVQHYGEVGSQNTFENIGWMLAAQDRNAWRTSGALFAA